VDIHLFSFYWAVLGICLFIAVAGPTFPNSDFWLQLAATLIGVFVGAGLAIKGQKLQEDRLRRTKGREFSSLVKAGVERTLVTLTNAQFWLSRNRIPDALIATEHFETAISEGACIYAFDPEGFERLMNAFYFCNYINRKIATVPGIEATLFHAELTDLRGSVKKATVECEAIYSRFGGNPSVKQGELSQLLAQLGERWDPLINEADKNS